MTARLLIVVLLVFGVAPAAHAEDKPPKPTARTISLSLDTQAMAAVPLIARVRSTPVATTAGLTAALQVRNRNGFETVSRASVDRLGAASLKVVSNRPGIKDYRAILLAPSGKVVAYAPPITVTWAPLVYAPTLDCSGSSAPVGSDVPCEVVITPPVRLADVVVSLESLSRTGWFPIDSFRPSAKGRVATDVTSPYVGSASFRVLLLRSARVIAESAITTIDFTAPGIPTDIPGHSG